ncbi:hypothetical protein GCM10027421_00810 [Microbacterium shaanxiense]
MGGNLISGLLSVARDAAWVQHGARVIAVDLAHLAQAPVVLEGTAAVIWETIAANDSTSLKQIISDLARDFDVDEDRIRDDVEEVVRSLTARGMLDAR